MKPLVSVIVPSYNSAAYLPEAIDSALNQTAAPLEVIVIDDGSTDETAQVLERYRGRIQAIFQQNKGPAAARNCGIAASRGDLIAFLDADDVWLPEKLEKQLAYLALHPAACMVHSQMYYWNPETGEKSLERHRRRHEFAGSCYHRLFFRPAVIPSTMVVRRECLAKVGTFDERIRRATAEDYDLCLRLARDYEFGFVDDPLILYRQHPGSSTKKQVLANYEDNLFVVRKLLEDDPRLRQELGRSVVNDRFFGLLFDIGYCHYEAGRPWAARPYFLQALRHRPASAHVWLLMLGSLLPARLVRKLRGLKTSLANIGRARLGRV